MNKKRDCPFIWSLSYIYPVWVGERPSPWHQALPLRGACSHRLCISTTCSQCPWRWCGPREYWELIYQVPCFPGSPEGCWVGTLKTVQNTNSLLTWTVPTCSGSVWFNECLNYTTFCFIMHLWSLHFSVIYLCHVNFFQTGGLLHTLCRNRVSFWQNPHWNFTPLVICSSI